MTVAQLFDLVAGLQARGVARLEVEYDRRFGYPRRVVVDVDGRLADDEFTYVTGSRKKKLADSS